MLSTRVLNKKMEENKINLHIKEKVEFLEYYKYRKNSFKYKKSFKLNELKTNSLVNFKKRINYCF